MRTHLLSIALFAATSFAGPAYSQVGQDLKDAGHDTKNAVKTGATKSAHAVKKGATKSAHAAKSGVHKGAAKVADKTKDTKPVK